MIPNYTTDTVYYSPPRRRAEKSAPVGRKITFEYVPIERGIPIPPKAIPIRKKRYPWRTMEILDSFVFPSPDGIPEAIRRVNSLKQKWCVLTTREFTYRVMDERGVQLVRIWRVA